MSEFVKMREEMKEVVGTLVYYTKYMTMKVKKYKNILFCENVFVAGLFVHVCLYCKNCIVNCLKDTNTCILFCNISCSYTLNVYSVCTITGMNKRTCFSCVFSIINIHKSSSC